jgi:hypothetical protein
MNDYQLDKCIFFEETDIHDNSNFSILPTWIDNFLFYNNPLYTDFYAKGIF